jgi:hypothetical protein
VCEPTTSVFFPYNPHISHQLKHIHNNEYMHQAAGIRNERELAGESLDKCELVSPLQGSTMSNRRSALQEAGDASQAE